jgi:hypothetical protein
MRRLYAVTRDLHLYLGLFVSPFILLFAVSVFLLVHGVGGDAPSPARSRTVEGIALSPDVARLSGPARIEALRPVLDRLGVRGEVDFVRHLAAEQRVIVPVRLPGRETTVTFDYGRQTADITSREQSLADVSVYLHRMPGPHNADIRGNSGVIRAWRVLADGTVYAFLFVTLSGVYLWLALRGERRIGLALLAAGACSFFGLVYAIVS